MALNPLFGTLDTLPFHARAFGALDALPFDPRALGALNALPLNPLFGTLDTLPLHARAFGPLDALPFDPRALGALDLLPFDPGPFRALDALALDFRPLSPLGALALSTLRAIGLLALGTRWPLRLALALAGLCTFAGIAAVALGVGRGGERDAGDAGDQEKLAAHDFYSLNKKPCISANWTR